MGLNSIGISSFWREVIINSLKSQSLLHNKYWETTAAEKQGFTTVTALVVEDINLSELMSILEGK